MPDDAAIINVMRRKGLIVGDEVTELGLSLYRQSLKINPAIKKFAEERSSEGYNENSIAKAALYMVIHQMLEDK
jgi:hypothetical protein